MLMRLTVLPPPFSSSIFPPLSLKQVAVLKGVLRAGQRQCYWCGKPISGRSQTLTIDHIIPQSKGGGRGLDNLVPCCGPCNLMKDSSDLPEWLARLEHMVTRLRQSLPVEC